MKTVEYDTRKYSNKGLAAIAANKLLKKWGSIAQKVSAAGMYVVYVHGQYGEMEIHCRF